MLLNVLDAAPRRVLLALCAVSIAMLGFGLYLQHVVGLNPCPMCIVQRYALLLVALVAGLTSLSQRRGFQVGGVALATACQGTVACATSVGSSWIWANSVSIRCIIS